MNTISVKKLDKEVKGLKSDIREIKKFLFTPTKDREGEYRESFVTKMFSRSQNKGPFYKFSGRDAFLKHAQTKK